VNHTVKGQLYSGSCPKIALHSKRHPVVMNTVHFSDPNCILALKVSSSSLLGIEQDAVNTFTKYISPDAAKPIPITEAMRNDIIGE
jgi:A-kinase anchor protein 10